MALSIGFRIFSFLPSCYLSYGALNFYPGGTFTHCSCQPSLDAHFAGLISRMVVFSRGKLAVISHRRRDKPAKWIADAKRVLRYQTARLPRTNFMRPSPSSWPGGQINQNHRSVFVPPVENDLLPVGRNIKRAHRGQVLEPRQASRAHRSQV